jgi:hypothetical protein
VKTFLLFLCALISLSAAEISPTAATASRGEQLARAYCQTCHLFPEPSLLDRQTWLNGALRRMAPLLGVARINLENRPDGKILKDARIFPDAPLVSEENWRAIVEYYAEKAPATPLPQKEQSPITPDLSLFVPHPLRYPEASHLTSLVRIDPAKSRIYIGNAAVPSLDLVSVEGRLISRVRLDSPPVDLTVRPEGIYLTLIGNMFPTDERNGKIVLLSEKDGQFSQKILVDKLGRPTSAILSDFNGDGREDLFLCSFGNYTGKLAWYESAPSGSLSEHILLEQPGGVNAIFNKANDREIFVLMAQARESIHRFALKEGQFQDQLIADFHPAFGSSHLELVDLNGDGFPDLLVTNGDNGDYPSRLKNYHGIRIFLNDRHGNFREDWFYALNGAFKAMAADFDNDGDLDLAAISFFPDYKEKPLESFVYFENRGGWNYVPLSFPDSALGRWLTMDVADMDGDGDKDIVLGSFADGPVSIPISPALQQNWKTNGASVMWLENQKRK